MHCLHLILDILDNPPYFSHFIKMGDFFFMVMRKQLILLIVKTS